MSSVSDRDQWTVSTGSFHYRLYWWWFRMSDKGPLSHSPPRPIDLCHYMRVVMIFVWLRWFFTSRLMPWAWTGLAVIIGVHIWAYKQWPATMKEILTWYGKIAIFIAIVGGVVFLASQLEKGKKLEGVGNAIERFLRAVFVPIARFLKPKFVWLWNKALEPTGTWFFRRTIFWRIYPWMFVPVIAFVIFAVLAPADNVLYVLMIAGIVIGGAVALIAVCVGAAFLIENLRDRYVTRKEKKEFEQLTKDPEPVEVVEPRVSQVREVLRLVWQYIVSRKHRICPFIVPTDGPTAGK